MSLYTLTVDLLAKTGSFGRDMGKAAWIADRDGKRIEAAALKIGAALGTAVAGAATGIAFMVRQNIAAMESTSKMAGQIGVATEELTALRYAAEQMAGVSSGQFDMALRRMTRRISEAAAGGGPAAKAIESMGLSAKELARQSPDEQFRRIADGIKATGDQGARLRHVMALMDTEGMPLVNMLQQGAAATREWELAAAKLGLTFTDATARQAEEFRQTMDRVNAAVAGFGRQVTAELLPDLLHLTDEFENVAAEGDRVNETAQDVANSIRAIGTATRFGIDGLRVFGHVAAGAWSSMTPWVDGMEHWRKAGGIARGMFDGQDRDLSPVFAGEGREPAGLFRMTEAQLQQQRARQAAAAAAAGSAQAEAATRKAQLELERQLEAIARYNREAEMVAATMAGPLEAAEESHRQRLAEIRKELDAGNMSQEADNALKADATDQLERTTRALEAQMRAPDDLLGAMREEIELLGMIGPERDLYRRGLQAEHQMRNAINRANEAGAGINDDVAASLIRQARSYAVTSQEVEEATRAVEDWRYTIGRNVEGVADLFSDLFSGQIKGTRDFFTELKDIWKRGWWDIVRMSLQQSFVNPIQKAISGMLNRQGYAAAGVGPANLAQGFAGNLLLGSGATAIGGGAAAAAGAPGWAIPGYGVGTVDPAIAAASGMGKGGLSGGLLTGSFKGGLPYASAALGAMGAYYGLTQRGNNPLVSGIAGLSYGAAGIAAGGAIAGGLGAMGAGATLGTVGAGAVSGATGAMGTAAGMAGSAGWIPVVGWALAAVAVVDIISGGRLFGTKYKPQNVTQQLGIDASGGMVSASVHETRKRSLFRGTARRDRELDATPEQRQAAQDLYEAMERVARSASRQLGLATVDIIAGSVAQVYDRDGELQSELSRVLGQTYAETFEEFTSRLASEQLIAAVARIDPAANRIAQDWRRSAEVLAGGAEFFMTAASDARNGMDLWTGIGLQALTDFVEKMQMADESLARTYARVAGTAGEYGKLVADINTSIMTDGLNEIQRQALEVERNYRQQVKAANDYAKALGLSGARSQDLAKIEELRALNMGKLQAQMEASNAAFLGQLGLSDLSTLRDDQKLAEAMRQLSDAAGTGDTQAAQQAAQAALGFGRNLYASGRDYQALYDQVTGQLSGMTMVPADLDQGRLADEIDAMHEGISRAIFELAAQGEHTITAPIRAEQQKTNELLGHVIDRLDRIQGNTDQRSRELRDSLNSRHAVLVR
ncbi:hypothetical protein [Luteimonas sp. A478]